MDIGPSGKLTPGSETEALMKDDIQSANKYAKVIGNPGDTLNHNHFALATNQFIQSHSMLANDKERAYE